MNEVDRASALYRIRMALGWSAANVGLRLEVTPRTVGMWETGAQPMSNARWRLFMHEVKTELERRRELVVVVAEDGITVLDVVSDANFFNFEVNEPLGIGIISSYAIDRHTGSAYLHSQEFPLAGNKHVLHAAKRWRLALEVGTSTGEPEMLALHRWLTRRVLEVERVNPRLRELKDKIAEASRDVDLVVNASNEERREKLEALDKAIFALIHEVEGHKMAM